MALPKRIREYIFLSLAAPPIAIKAMLRDLPADSSFWDFKPDPERFTPREVLAHVSDWNPIFHERLVRTLNEAHATLEDFDEGQFAIDRCYSTSDPLQSLSKYVKEREAIVETVKNLTEEQWDKTAYRETMGEVSIEAQVVLIGVHDGYHLRQIAEYLEAWKGA